jgi:hypothetical protein
LNQRLCSALHTDTIETQETTVKKLILCAAIAATVMGALPASGDVVVRDRDGDRDGYRHRNEWRRHHADCRVVKIRTRMANGTVIIRTKRMCGR